MINLGDKVKDTVSGFEGIAVCRHSYLNGCDRITVQPPTNKDGTLPAELSFDEPQLKVTKKKVVAEGNKETGGPEKHKPQAKSTGARS